jgi:N-acetyl-anhydromuramyl-L-alanine amidase AmpD
LERYNDDSLAVCLVGGRHPSDEIGGVKKLWPSYLDVQLGALKRVLQSWSAQHSGAKPYGISDLEPDRTQMPGFDVPLWYRGGGLVPTLTTASPYVTDPTNES